MTDESKKTAVSLEIRHGEIALQAARMLRQAGLYNDALSRLYYALFHAMTALLLARGLEPRRHRALVSLLGTHVVPTGLLTASDIALVSRVCGYRDLADYERTWEATDAIAGEAFDAVEALVARARAALESEGLLSP